MKHFHGYASNSDTHAGISIYNKTYEESLNQMLPFETGTDVVTEAIHIDNNIVKCIDSELRLLPVYHLTYTIYLEII